MFLSNLRTRLSDQKGFTLPELMIVFGITSMLFGIVTFNFIRFQGSTSKQSNINVLISDMKSQQLKAMLGNTEGRSANDSYGIYFLSDKYILFHGTSYDSLDNANFPVDLPPDINIQSTTFPDNTIVFTKISGEIFGFSEGANTITIRALNINEDSVVSLNRYGVITGTN